MIYIYFCYGGTHSSCLAAAYHLKLLDEKREPTKEEILSTPLFNQLVYGNIGELFYHGKDEAGDLVYTVGRGREKHMVPALYNLATMLQNQKILNERIAFSNTLPTVPIAMTFGGLFSRWLKIDFIGIPLLIKGAHQNYQNIIRLVKHTRKSLETSKSPIILLDNEEFKTGFMS